MRKFENRLGWQTGSEAGGSSCKFPGTGDEKKREREMTQSSDASLRQCCYCFELVFTFFTTRVYLSNSSFLLVLWALDDYRSPPLYTRTCARPRNILAIKAPCTKLLVGRWLIICVLSRPALLLREHSCTVRSSDHPTIRDRSKSMQRTDDPRVLFARFYTVTRLNAFRWIDGGFSLRTINQLTVAISLQSAHQCVSR